MSSAKSMKMITLEQQKKTSENNQNNDNNNYPAKKLQENVGVDAINNQSTDNSLNLHLDNVVRVIKEGVLKKKSPWFHYNTRKVILDTTPKIEYIDPVSGVVKVRLSFFFNNKKIFFKIFSIFR